LQQDLRRIGKPKEANKTTVLLIPSHIGIFEQGKKKKGIKRNEGIID
jgi:hypothetical protein